MIDKFLKYTLDLLTIIVPIIITLGTIYLKDYVIKKRLDTKSKRQSPLNRSNYYIELNRICFVIRDSLNANGVYISYFHNGTHYHNGMSMDKYSVVAEDYDHKIKKSYKNIQNVSIHTIEYLNHRLLTNNRFAIEDTLDDKIEETMIDPIYATSILERDIRSNYVYILKDPVSEIPIGFISIEFMYKRLKDEVDESIIWKHVNRISNIINEIK